MWIKRPDFYVSMPLLSVPVESNLKCQAFTILLHIYTVLRPCALFSPECPQGSEGSRSSRRSKLTLSHIRTRSILAAHCLEGSCSVSLCIFWNCCCGTAQGFSTSSKFSRGDSKVDFTDIFPVHMLAAKELGLSSLEPHLLGSGVMMMEKLSFNHFSY